mgnify:CR=1
KGRKLRGKREVEKRHDFFWKVANEIAVHGRNAAAAAEGGAVRAGQERRLCCLFTRRHGFLRVVAPHASNAGLAFEEDSVAPVCE